MRIRSGALRLGLGTMRLEGADAISLLHRALDSGIRLFVGQKTYNGVAVVTRKIVTTPVLASRRVDARADREERKGKRPSDHAPVIPDFS